MTDQQQTSRQYLRAINIVFFGLLGGQLLFALITLYLHLGLDYSFGEVADIQNIFMILVPVMVLNGFVTGQLVYNSRIKKARVMNTLIEKTAAYRGAIVVRLAMLEGASLFAIVVYLLTADLWFIGMAGIVIVYFFMLRPSAEKIVEELGLDPSETHKFLDPDQIVAETASNNY